MRGEIGINIYREIGVSKETKYMKHREEYFKENLHKYVIIIKMKAGEKGYLF